MERREVLRGGLLLGAGLAGPGVAWADADDVRPVSFFEGVLQGSSFAGWPFS